VKLSNDGLTLWYGLPDTPAPGENGASRSGASLTMAVTPPSQANNVVVRYRVDGKRTALLPAWEIRTDYDRQIQYFRTNFPTFVDGVAEMVVLDAIRASAATGKEMPCTF